MRKPLRETTKHCKALVRQAVLRIHQPYLFSSRSPNLNQLNICGHSLNNLYSCKLLNEIKTILLSMSLKAFIKNLLAFLKELFGDKKETVQPSTTTKPATTKPATNPIHPSVGIIDPVEFSFHFGKYPVEEQIRIKNIINQNAADGVLNYTIDMPDRIYRIVNGSQILESTEGKSKQTKE